MRATVPFLVLLASAAGVGACVNDDDCWERTAAGWVALPEGDAGASADGGALDADGADARRVPPVVVVNEAGAAPDADGPVRRDDAGAAASDAGASDAGTADAGASDASIAPDASGGAEAGAADDAGASAADGAATEAGSGAALDAGDAGAGDAGGTRDWSALTCDRICAEVLGDGWVIRGCRPPARGDVTGRLYVYCEATYGSCRH